MIKLTDLLKEIEDERELDEMMDTDSGGEYDTPNAFTKNGRIKRPHLDPAYDQLAEISYNQFKTDETMSPKQKINTNIMEIYRKLREVETMMTHAKRLKTEIGEDQVYWKGTVAKFGKISEKLNKISTRIREMWT